MNQSFNPTTLRAHVIWPHGRSGLVASQDTGIIQLANGVFTFTSKDGQALLSIPLSQVKKFSAGYVASNSGGYLFHIETSEQPSSKYNFSAIHGLGAKKIYGLSNEDRAQDVIKGGPWLTVFRQAGIKTTNYSRVTLYTWSAFISLFLIWGLALT